eukprot:CAMPEP_0194529970 /NCGR_PEP_ID=MMETSP0253-20130528/66802_1 /TAXON_ID=2966 /ORGANISM="Noctiluca scintillans" /LENGTH=159 /DNA_ID=CAMNT_0039375153 /DNA_START=68 /DNA_END=547 /DNA_ORIENTATION=+
MAKGPPLMALLFGLMLGSLMLITTLMDLAVNLTNDKALVIAWYSNQPLPMFEWILPPKGAIVCLIPLLFAKIVFVEIPGAWRGKPGHAFGCAPAVLLPIIISLALKCKQMAPEATGVPEPELNQFLVGRASASFLMIVCNVRAWVLQRNAAEASVKKDQ